MHYPCNVHGQIVDIAALLTYNGQSLYPAYAHRNPFPDRSILTRTQAQYDMIRANAMVLVEVDPNVAGLVTAIVNYVVGSGIGVQVSPEKSDPFDEWMEEQELDAAYFAETIRRYIVQGEVFIRRFNTEDGPSLRFIEPDAIRPPKSENHEGPWSFGIRTDLRDTATPLEYNILYAENEEEQVPADEMYRWKNSFMNQKRGISALNVLLEEATETREHRRTVRTGDKIRQSIAYFRQHAKADSDAIASMQDAILADQRAATGCSGASSCTCGQCDAVPMEVGSTVDIPKSLEVKDPPQNRGAKEVSIPIIVKGYESIAAAVNAPYYLASGDTTGTNFASSLVSESPFTRAIESHQGGLVRFWHRILNDSREVLVEMGANIPGTVEVVASSPVSRNLLDEAKANEILSKNGVLSDPTWAGRADLDYQVEVERGAAKEEPDEPDEEGSAPAEPRTEDLE